MFTFTIQSFADREDGGVSHMAVLPPLPLLVCKTLPIGTLPLSKEKLLF